MLGYYLKLALRRSRQRSGSVALIVVTMAVGIAAFITALSIFAALEGQPLPGVTEQMYVVTMDARGTVDSSASHYDSPDSLLTLRDAKALVDAHRASGQVALAVSQTNVANPDGRQSDVVNGLLAYGPVLQELGVPLRFGRPWTAVEQADGVPVAVIDTKLAEQLFGTTDGVGRSVAINHHLFRVIGVTTRWKPRVTFVDTGRDAGPGEYTQLFLPLNAALAASVGPLNSGECGGSATNAVFGTVDVQVCRWLEVWVSLKNSASVATYQRFIANYAGTQHSAGRFVYPPHAKLYSTRAWMVLNRVIPDDVTLNVILAGAFLLICTLNVIGILTTRFRRRRVDAAVRRALGASRQQIFVQHLVESGLLGLFGGTLALPLTSLGMWIVRQQSASYAPAARFGPNIFFALVALSLLVGIIVGILPAWRACRLPPAVQIRQT